MKKSILTMTVAAVIGLTLTGCVGATVNPLKKESVQERKTEYAKSGLNIYERFTGRRGIKKKVYNIIGPSPHLTKKEREILKKNIKDDLLKQFEYTNENMFKKQKALIDKNYRNPFSIDNEKKKYVRLLIVKIRLTDRDLVDKWWYTTYNGYSTDVYYAIPYYSNDKKELSELNERSYVYRKLLFVDISKPSDYYAKMLNSKKYYDRNKINNFGTPEVEFDKYYLFEVIKYYTTRDEASGGLENWYKYDFKNNVNFSKMWISRVNPKHPINLENNIFDYNDIFYSKVYLASEYRKKDFKIDEYVGGKLQKLYTSHDEAFKALLKEVFTGGAEQKNVENINKYAQHNGYVDQKPWEKAVVTQIKIDQYYKRVYEKMEKMRKQKARKEQLQKEARMKARKAKLEQYREMKKKKLEEKAKKEELQREAKLKELMKED